MPTEVPSQGLIAEKRFLVGFSFADEKRKFVGQVANLLADKIGKPRVLYDEFHKPEFARPRLSFYLPKLYREQCGLIVVILCKDYESKRWTGWEWSQIFSLVTQDDDWRIMPCRFEHAIVEGLGYTSGYIELDKMKPADLVQVILDRIEFEKIRRNSSSSDEKSIEKLPHSKMRSRISGLVTVFALAIVAVTCWNLKPWFLPNSDSHSDDGFPPPEPPTNIPSLLNSGLAELSDSDRSQTDFAFTIITVQNETDESIRVSFDYRPRPNDGQDSSLAHRITETILPRTVAAIEETNIGGPCHLSILANGEWYPENNWVDLKILPERTLVVTKTADGFQCNVRFDRHSK